MNTKTLLAVIAALVVAIGSVVGYINHQQHKAAEKERAEQAQRSAQEQQRQTSVDRSAEEYHQARKKTGEFLVPDTKSRMRFDENSGTPTATPANSPAR